KDPAEIQLPNNDLTSAALSMRTLVARLAFLDTGRVPMNKMLAVLGRLAFLSAATVRAFNDWSSEACCLTTFDCESRTTPAQDADLDRFEKSIVCVEGCTGVGCVSLCGHCRSCFNTCGGAKHFLQIYPGFPNTSIRFCPDSGLRSYIADCAAAAPAPPRVSLLGGGTPARELVVDDYQDTKPPTAAPTASPIVAWTFAPTSAPVGEGGGGSDSGKVRGGSSGGDGEGFCRSNSDCGAELTAYDKE
ncbi:unnamed protein product, partial [Phaeothamnion confervicola]